MKNIKENIMRGRNSLTFCTTELCNAVEYYLNNKLFVQPIEVENITINSDITTSFKIQLKENKNDNP